MGSGRSGQRESVLAPTARRPCLLIVEDDPVVGELLSMLVRDNGYDPMLCPEVTTSLQLAAAGHPALILLDLGLPDLDGRSLLTALKENPATATIPVIVTSGFAHTLSPKERSLAAAVFSKPIDSAKLLAAIARALDQSVTGQSTGWARRVGSLWAHGPGRVGRALSSFTRRA